MFFASNNERRENIATLSGYIFVFGDEVFNITTLIFLLLYEAGLYLMRCKPKCSLEKFLLLLIQNIEQDSQARKMKEMMGRQKISSTCDIHSGEQLLGY